MNSRMLDQKKKQLPLASMAQKSDVKKEEEERARKRLVGATGKKGSAEWAVGAAEGPSRRSKGGSHTQTVCRAYQQEGGARGERRSSNNGGEGKWSFGAGCWLVRRPAKRPPPKGGAYRSSLFSTSFLSPYLSSPALYNSKRNQTSAEFSRNDQRDNRRRLMQPFGQKCLCIHQKCLHTN